MVNNISLITSSNNNMTAIIPTMKRLKTAVVATVLLSVLAVGTVGASTQGYYALDNKSQIGMLMSLSPNAEVIEPTNTKNDASLVGVVVPDDETDLSRQSGQVSVKLQAQRPHLQAPTRYKSR